MMLNIFSCAYWPFIYLLWRNVCLNPLLTFNWAICLLFCSFICSYIFWTINPLSKIQFANIFYHLVGCLFILLIVFFAVQKFLVSYHFTCLFFFSCLSFFQLWEKITRLWYRIQLSYISDIYPIQIFCQFCFCSTIPEYLVCSMVLMLGGREKYN